MISAWHLLWIVPICNCLSLFAMGMCCANARSKQLIEAYNAGQRDGRKKEDIIGS